MLKKIIALSILTTILSGCVSGSGSYLKRSANNKIFDRHGFKGGKRDPLYNKQYIKKAKENIINENYEEEDFDGYEEDNIALRNRQIYMDLIEKEQKKSKKKKLSIKKPYPKLDSFNKKLEEQEKRESLHDELEEIKEMLHQARKELSSFKCPSADQLLKEANKEQKGSSNISKQEENKNKEEEEIADDKEDNSRPKPIHSI